MQANMNVYISPPRDAGIMQAIRTRGRLSTGTRGEQITNHEAEWSPSSFCQGKAGDASMALPADESTQAEPDRLSELFGASPPSYHRRLVSKHERPVSFVPGLRQAVPLPADEGSGHCTQAHVRQARDRTAESRPSVADFLA